MSEGMISYVSTQMQLSKKVHYHKAQFLPAAPKDEDMWNK